MSSNKLTTFIEEKANLYDYRKIGTELGQTKLGEKKLVQWEIRCLMAFYDSSSYRLSLHSREEVSEEALKYYLKRFQYTQSNYLKFRYGYYAYQLSQEKNVRFKQENTSQLLETAITLLANERVGPYDLNAVINQSIGLLAEETLPRQLMDRFVDALITYEARIFDPLKLGYWGYGMELLVNDKIRRKLKANKKKLILDNYIECLGLATDRAGLRSLVEPLLDYYRITGQLEEEIHFILTSHEDRLERRKSSRDYSPIRYWHDLDELRSVYQSLAKGLNKFALLLEGILLKIETVKIPWEKDLERLSVDLPDLSSKIWEYYSILNKTDKKEGPQGVFSQIAKWFVMNTQTTEASFKKSLERNPLQFMVTNMDLDSEGIPLKIESLTPGNFNPQNYKSHLSRYMKNYGSPDIFLEASLEWVVEKYKVKIPQLLLSSNRFKGYDEEMIEKILLTFQDKDCFTFCHLVIPMIENGIRNVLKSSGVPTLTFDGSAYVYHTLQVLLREEKYRECIDAQFDYVAGSASEYLAFVLIDRYGFNYRNNLAHGKNIAIFNNYNVACRLLHVLILLTTQKKN